MVRIIQEDYSKVKVLADDRDILLQIFNYFAYYVDGYKYQPLYKSGRWDGKIKLFDFIEKKLPIGLLSQLEEFLDSNDIEYKKEFYQDDEFFITPEYLESFIKKLNIPAHLEIRDYQKELVLKSINERQSVAISATSSGKSISIYIIAMIMLANKKRVFLIVPSVGLVHQMYDDFISYGLPEDKAQSLIHKIHSGQEKAFTKPIIITTWQSVHKPAVLREFTSKVNGTEKQYDCIMCDEAHLVKAGDGKKIADIVEAFTYSPWKMGFTGSLPKDELTKQQIISALGKPIPIVNASELVEMGYATDLKVTAVFLKYPKEDIDYVRSKECRKNWNNEVTFFNEHPAKLKFILALVKSKLDKGENCIIFFKRVAFGKLLFKEISKLTKNAHYIDGSIDGEVRNAIRGEIERNESTALVASYKTTSTGISIKKLHTGILAEDLGKSDTTLVQTLGRFLRQHEDKDISNIYDIIDDCRYKKTYQNYMYRHFLDRLETYRTEGWFVHEKEYFL